MINSRTFIFCLTFLLAVPACSLLAQEYSYAHYDVKEGLPSSTVYCMAEDRDGFIWFGTDAGLSRFDGAHFTNFTTADGLPDNDILRLFVDSHNRIWITPFRHAIAYYWKGKIYTARNDSLLAKLNIGDEVHTIAEDRSGNILIQELRMSHIIDPAGHITGITKVNGKPFGSFYVGLNKDHEFSALIFQNVSYFIDTLFFADLRNGKFIPTRRVPDEEGYSYSGNYTLIRPYLEVSRYKETLLFHPTRDHSDFNIPIPKGFISICNVDDSTVALNSHGGVFLVNIAQKKITDTFLKGQTVNWTMEDEEGNLWLSTLGQGVFRMGSREFRNYSIKLHDLGLPVFSVQKIDSTLYIGADHFVLGELSRDKKNISCHRIDTGETWGRIMSISKPPGAPDILLGTDNGAFFQKKRIMFSQKKQIMIRLSVKTISSKNDSQLVIFSGQGVTVISSKDLHFMERITLKRSTCGFVQQGVVYMGALDGLYMFGSDSRLVFLGDRNDLLKNRISAIDGDADGMLWIGTSGDGLVGYKQGRVVAHISQPDGLTSNICRNIFVSGKDVWVGTDKGLNKITCSGNAYTIIPYTTGDGLNSDIINAIYVEGTQVYAGTSAGLMSFDESKIARRSECKLHFTAIHAGDRKWNFDTTDLIIPRKDNNLQFEFAGISFKSAGNMNYQFRLTGLDDQWHTSRQTFLNYPALPYGTYDLEIIAINKFGVRSDTRHVRFTVEKLFLEKTWVRLSVIVLVAGLVWLFFTYRLRAIRKKDTEKTETIEKMAELEQMALRSQMNPHFIFNCLNSIQDYVIGKDIRGANEFITKFAHLIRQTLDFSAKPLISLSEEIDYISTYMELENRRFGNKFVSSVLVSDKIDRQSYHIPPMILQPYIENAVRHGIGHRQDKDGRIQIRMECQGSYFACVIEDNGVGRRQATQYKGLNAINYQSRGMTLVAKRIEVLNKTNKSPIFIDITDLEDQEGRPSGTRITLNFPLDQVRK